MPGKRARSHFSQLSELERGLITGMKTAGWSTRRVAGQVDRSECAVRMFLGAVDTRRYPRVENRVWSDQEDHEERGSKDRATSISGPTVTHSNIRADVGVAIVPQTIYRHLAEANLKSKCPFRALPLTPEHRQLRLQ
ncbi:transposable element Tc1 transposase [Trichonephila clavipes]|nr:transposable element Tc1 transposase [Trichonephila clavipes]